MKNFLINKYKKYYWYLMWKDVGLQTCCLLTFVQ